jgi:hypothetical protein
MQMAQIGIALNNNSLCVCVVCVCMYAHGWDVWVWVWFVCVRARARACERACVQLYWCVGVLGVSHLPPKPCIRGFSYNKKKFSFFE